MENLKNMAPFFLAPAYNQLHLLTYITRTLSRTEFEVTIDPRSLTKYTSCGYSDWLPQKTFPFFAIQQAFRQSFATISYIAIDEAFSASKQRASCLKFRSLKIQQNALHR